MGGAAAAGLITLLTFVALIRSSVRNQRGTNHVSTTISYLLSLTTLYKCGFLLHFTGKGSLFQQTIAVDGHTLHYFPMTPMPGIIRGSDELCVWNITEVKQIMLPPGQAAYHTDAFTVTCDYATFAALTVDYVHLGPDKQDPVRNIRAFSIGNVSVDKLFLEESVNELLRTMQMHIGKADPRTLEQDVAAIKKQRDTAINAPLDTVGGMVWDTQFDGMAFYCQAALDGATALIHKLSGVFDLLG